MAYICEFMDCFLFLWALDTVLRAILRRLWAIFYLTGINHQSI